MAQLELDPHFIQGLRLLHSINKDSADQLRTLLDEAIKQKHGPVKMLCNVLHKKVFIFRGISLVEKSQFYSNFI